MVEEKEHFSWKKMRVSLVEKNVRITERFFDNHYKLENPFLPRSIFSLDAIAAVESVSDFP